MKKNYFNMKQIVKTALAISAIYIMAVIMSLVTCDRLAELENQEDILKQNSNIMMQIK